MTKNPDGSVTVEGWISARIAAAIHSGAACRSVTVRLEMPERGMLTPAKITIQTLWPAPEPTLMEAMEAHEKAAPCEFNEPYGPTWIKVLAAYRREKAKREGE